MEIIAKVVKPSLTPSKCSKSITFVSDLEETQESMVLQAKAQTQTQLPFHY